MSIEYICHHAVHTDALKNLFNSCYKGKLNLLVCGPVVHTQEQINKIKNFKGIKILVINEPIKHLDIGYEKAYILYRNNTFNIIMGSVVHKPIKNLFKYPHYLLEYNGGDATVRGLPQNGKAGRKFFDSNDQSIFKNANEYVKNIPVIGKLCIADKIFCCLIASHDMGGTRTIMHNKLKNIGLIVCPGRHFNNTSPDVLNKLGKHLYLRKFLFTICAENWDYGNIPGYITEKLLDACIGGCIPIYAGHFGALDAKIFNRERILFYNSQDPRSIDIVYNKICNLLRNKQELVEFYRQPVFCDTAFETIQKLKTDLFDKLNAL